MSFALGFPVSLPNPLPAFIWMPLTCPSPKLPKGIIVDLFKGFSCYYGLMVDAPAASNLIQPVNQVVLCRANIFFYDPANGCGYLFYGFI